VVKDRVTESEYYRSTLFMKLHNETHQKGAGRERRSRKSNIDGVNLNQMHDMHVVNMTMKPLCTISLLQ
jgi:hypothetical protein